MFAKWLEEYKRFSEKLGFISKFSSFIISIFTFLSIYDIVRFFYFNPDYLNWNKIEGLEIVIPIIFQISILVIFVSRFVFLFFTKSNAFWISQFLSLIGILTLLAYWYYSRPVTIEIYFSLPHTSIFKHASNSLEGYGIYYLILSPIKKIITLAIALFKAKCAQF